MTKIVDLFALRPKKGKIGLELEVETGRRFPERGFDEWALVGDGSLRGGGEFVLKKPLDKDAAFSALDNLHQCLEAAGTTLHDSDRTSTHVHINVQKLNLTQLYNFMVVYLLLEDLLVKYCGPSREGNLFCLRSSDADYLIRFLADVASTGNHSAFGTNQVRYASMNVCSIPKFGSLEFRAMRGMVTDPAFIKDWVNILLRLEEKALQYRDPKDILMNLSMDGGERFAQNILGEYYEQVECLNMEEILRNSMRSVQEIAYAREDWDFRKK
jgi:hypothetical protein